MFLRTTEFLWQEGHTAHATHDEAVEEVLRMLDVYADVAENVMAMPVIKGVKTQPEKFAGALQSYSIEAMMQNGFALQAGTSHDLGQNFGKAFNVQFQNSEGQLDYVWQTSWGVSTRLIGGLIMSHSDDKGLVLPPKLAPTKAVMVPIYRKDEEKAKVLEAAHRIAKEVGAKVDDREGQSPGAKFFHWERRGVPVVLELGPRDLAAGNVVLKRRDTGTKEPMPQSDLAAKLPALLETDAEGHVQRRQTAPEGQHRAGELDRGGRVDPERRDCRKRRRQIRHGAPQGRPALRCAREGVQGHRPQHPAGRRIRRRRQVHRHRRGSRSPRSYREGVLKPSDVCTHDVATLWLTGLVFSASGARSGGSRSTNRSNNNRHNTFRICYSPRSAHFPNAVIRAQNTSAVPHTFAIFECVGEPSPILPRHQLRDRFVLQRLVIVQYPHSAERPQQLIRLQQMHGMARAAAKLELLARIRLEHQQPSRP